MMPASNMKIVTLATAAETLGWDYRFTTTLETAAAGRGRHAGGRPHRPRRRRSDDQRARRPRRSRVRRVGRRAQGGRHHPHRRTIVGDDNAFDDATLGGGWAWDYLQDGYAAPVGALEFNENVARVDRAPGRATRATPCSIELAPGAGLRLVNRASPASRVADDDRFRAPADSRRSTSPARWPVDAQPVDARGRGRQPDDLLRPVAARTALVARGIEVTGDAIDADDMLDTPAPRRAARARRSHSPPLRDIATTMMKVSQNLYAETLLKAIGAANGRRWAPPKAAASATRALFDSGASRTDSYVQVDGSGLSRYDYVTRTCRRRSSSTCIRDPRHHDAFVATLPIAGKDGTIASRMKKTRAEATRRRRPDRSRTCARCRATCARATARSLAFSILANNFTDSRRDRELDRGPRGRDARELQPEVDPRVQGRGSGLRSVFASRPSASLAYDFSFPSAI